VVGGGPKDEIAQNNGLLRSVRYSVSSESHPSELLLGDWCFGPLFPLMAASGYPKILFWSHPNF
jgi:hypothetical protein